MPNRVSRSRTAEAVSQILGTPEGREHLARYGWVQGMPVVMTTPNEPLEDVMALASIHSRSVLVALLHPYTAELRFLHISEPNAALQNQPAESAATTIFDLHERVEARGLETFRVKHWKHSAVAHGIPVFTAKQRPIGRAYRSRVA